MKNIENSDVQSSIGESEPIERSLKAAKGSQRISQADVPSYSLEQAIRIPRAIAENYGFAPSSPFDVAAALELAPNSSSFRMLTGASLAFGLTSGGAAAPEISITPLGLQIVRPLAEGDALLAMREAILKPRVFSEFLRKYDNAPLPKAEIAQNVLLSLNVPKDRTERVLQLILESAEAVGFIRLIKDKKYIDLKAVSGLKNPEDSTFGPSDAQEGTHEGSPVSSVPRYLPVEVQKPTDINNRVFITHGKNTQIVEQLKKLLTFGNFLPVVAAEHVTLSKPVPEKVLDDMRTCSAAIIHVGKEVKVLDQDGKEHVFLNQNVLIEIGAAMALYNKRFILLVETGVALPSNLQGLYEVRYVGDALDYEATMKLLAAFNDFKHPSSTN